jgi:hypothetical protein
LNGLAIEDVGIFGSILLPFGIFYGLKVYFPRFRLLCQEKSGNPALL